MTRRLRLGGGLTVLAVAVGLLAGGCPPQLVDEGGTDLRRYLHEPPLRMCEKPLVSLAEIALPTVLVLVERSPVLHAPAPADRQMPAKKAFVAQVPLRPRKLPLLRRSRQLLNRCLENIPQPPPRLHEKIAAERVTRVLDHYVLAALPVERAYRVPAVHVI